MPINDFTKYRIANKWINNQIDKNQFEFTNKGNFAFGKLTWSTPKKENGQQTYIYSKIDFTCFGDNIALFEKNLGSSFKLIESSLQQEKYKDKDGKDKYNWKLIIYKADLINDNLNSSINKHNQDKANGYQPEAEIENDFNDEIPF